MYTLCSNNTPINILCNVVFHSLSDTYQNTPSQPPHTHLTQVMVSGGSALPPHIDSFFDMIHVNVIAGYGLTETAPTLLNRPSERNVLGTVGVPPPGTL